MAVSERRRHALHEAFVETFGADVAETAMDLLPPVGWTDVATRQDLDHLAVRTDLRFDAVDTRLDGLDHRLDGLDRRFDRMDARLEERFEQVDARFEQVDARFERLETQLDRMDGRFDRMDARFDEFGARFDELGGDLRRFVFQVVGLVTGAMATTAVVLRLL